ncbi:hypothetical protein DITRI_Ditri17bG0066900 [Diplodiscus trichospermus]
MKAHFYFKRSYGPKGIYNEPTHITEVHSKRACSVYVPPALHYSIHKQSNGVDATVGKDQLCDEKVKEVNDTNKKLRDQSMVTKWGMNRIVSDQAIHLDIWDMGAMNDISGVERVIEEMKRDAEVAGDWTTYSSISAAYVDVGLFEKAEKALKELEKGDGGKWVSSSETTGTVMQHFEQKKDVDGAEIFLQITKKDADSVEVFE